ncbi:unnamed protein product [Urochloa humidicola]
MADLAVLHDKISRSVVTISNGADNRDGIVVACTPRLTYIIADERGLFVNGQSAVRVTFPGSNIGTHISYTTTNNGLIAIVCHNINRMQQPGLEPVEFYEGDLKELQDVYCYSDQFTDKTLTPGAISSFFTGGFNHTCSAHYISQYGSLVINSSAQLVGMNFKYNHYLSAYNTAAIAAKMEQNNLRTFTTIGAAIQFVRQLAA